MTTKKTEETKEVIEKPENNDCFIIMPIADHLNYKEGHFKRVYEDIFKPACIAAGYRPVRADDTKQANLIQLDILQKLLESPMAICDLSTRNPNVLFELGLRQAFDKPTILVQEEGTPKIFDINILRYVEYRNGLDYRDVLADQRTIQEVLEETKQAVIDGKSVNSIIKLLSITNPASLQDTSNFGEKEYLKIIMSEISAIKKEIQKSELRNSNDHTKNSKDINERASRYIYNVVFSRRLTTKERDNVLDMLFTAISSDLRIIGWPAKNPKFDLLDMIIYLEDPEDLPTSQIKAVIKAMNLPDVEVLGASKARVSN